MPPSLKEEPCAAAGSEPLQMQLDGSQRREAQLQQQVRVRPRHFTNISSRYQVSGVVDHGVHSTASQIPSRPGCRW